MLCACRLSTPVSTAIHKFGYMLFMPFGIPILGTTVILGGSLTDARGVCTPQAPSIRSEFDLSRE